MAANARLLEPGGCGARTDVVFIAHEPPPLHGQAVADQLLAAANYPSLALRVVPMRAARDLPDIGRFRAAKVLGALAVVAAVLRHRSAGRRDVLVCSLGARSRLPVLRDAMVLAVVRPFFDRTVLHVHTGGYATLVAELPAPLRGLAQRAFGQAELILLDPLLDDPTSRTPRPLKVHYLPYGVADLCSEGSHQRGVPSIDAAPPLVCFLGNLYSAKGTLDLVRAAGLLRDRGVAFRLVLAGDVPAPRDAGALHQLVADLALEAQVRVSPPVFGAAKAELLRSAAVLCLPTHYEAEGLPLVILEAMAAGLPVVATRWRAIPAMVGHGETGFLVEPGDVGELGDRLEELLRQPAMAAAFGATGRARFEERHTALAFQQGFEAILSGRHPAGSAFGEFGREFPSHLASPAGHG